MERRIHPHLELGFKSQNQSKEKKENANKYMELILCYFSILTPVVWFLQLWIIHSMIDIQLALSQNFPAKRKILEL